MSPRPNILLVMTDQHNRAIAGCYGDDVVRTPNLETLAGGGVPDFVRFAPDDAAFLEGEQWEGPKDYGTVREM